MANPIFDSADKNITLTTNSARRRWSAPQNRFSATSLPGVDGVMLSTFGFGGRYIMGGGFLEATGASASLADKALAAAIRLAQVGIGTISTYDDIDDETYGDCMLVSYTPMSPVEIEDLTAVVGGEHTARVAVQFVILQQDPTA
ncbi:MAG: hypothetical protein KAV00_06830 [Phycisphaerae bacterium]|nr:hypothetical protein [Phycisphaerae bacterium]